MLCMSELVRPVERVGDIIVVGERHRERSSRELLFEVWDDIDESVGGLCVEVSPNTGYRDNGGGAVGGALVRAEAENIPRYYVDEPINDVIEAFGGRLSAYSYLKGLEDRFPSRDGGIVDMEECQAIRDEVRADYGEDAFDLVFENREGRMAGRAKWIESDVSGVVFLVVGSGHFEAIVSLLNGNCGEIVVENRRVRTGERIAANQGPWGTMLTLCFRDLKRLYESLRQSYQDGHLL